MEASAPTFVGAVKLEGFLSSSDHPPALGLWARRPRWGVRKTGTSQPVFAHPLKHKEILTRVS